MIPKWVGIVWFGIPLVVMWTNLLVLEPHMGVHELRNFRGGELYILSVLTMLWALVSLMVWAWNDKVDKPEDL